MKYTVHLTSFVEQDVNQNSVPSYIFLLNFIGICFHYDEPEVRAWRYNLLTEGDEN